jgi:hypothetical protein
VDDQPLLFPGLSFSRPRRKLKRQPTGRQRQLFYHPDYERYTMVKMRNTPKWFDARMVEVFFYAVARRWTKERGKLYVVDHIVPLNHPLVCGLHSQHNLRVVPWRENASKGNRWWPDMPTDQYLLPLENRT